MLLWHLLRMVSSFGILECHDSLLKVLVVFGRNGKALPLITELAQLMEKPFGELEQIALHF